MESKINNIIKPQKEVDTLINRCENGLVLQNVRQARELILELVSKLKGKDKETEEL